MCATDKPKDDATDKDKSPTREAGNGDSTAAPEKPRRAAGAVQFATVS